MPEVRQGLIPCRDSAGIIPYRATVSGQEQVQISVSGIIMGKNNFSRFYALLRLNPRVDKEEMVMQFTDGRTTSLREMSKAEFASMCDAMEYGSQEREDLHLKNLKRARSSVLLRIGRLGINTVDNWDVIDAFCMSPKIAGKKFSHLSVPELQALIPKLENIIRKGGLRNRQEEATDILPESMKNGVIFFNFNKLKN